MRAQWRPGEPLRPLVKREILSVLEGAERPLPDAASPRVVLVVGVNGDASVRGLDKGAARPIVGEAARAEIVGNECRRRRGRG